MNAPAATVPVFVTAFSGDAPPLDALLQRLRVELPGVAVAILGSEDSKLEAVAQQHAVPLRNVLPQQADDTRYWCGVLDALEQEQGPLIVLRAGTQLPRYWYGRLLPRAADVPAIQFPLGLRHPCSSIFADPAQPSGLDVDTLDTWLNCHAPGKVFDMPLLAGWTAWLQPQRCARIKAADDASLARALIEAGEQVLATDALAVDDSAFSPLALPALYPAWGSALLSHHPLAVMRHAMAERAGRVEMPPAELPRTKPVRLHLSHGWGGGLWRWVDDFSTADQDCHNFILRPVGEPDGFGKALQLLAAGDDGPLASWTLARPILSTALSHYEYAMLLRDIIATFHVNEIYVSSLIGHSLDALQSGLPTTLVLHDFYPLCPLIMASWDGPCSHCDDARMADCLQHNPAQRFFDQEPNTYWQGLRQRFVALVCEQPIQLVAPTPSVARRWQQLAPQLPAQRFHVIAHGLPAPLLQNIAEAHSQMEAAEPVAPDGRLKLLVLGSLEQHKGGRLLHEALPVLREHCELVLLGPGESGAAFLELSGVRVVPDYQRERLGELLAEQHADLGLLLSTVPETFSYTLSELQAAGIPVVATDLGAFADRIIVEETGWLIEPRAQALVTLLQALHADRARIARVRRVLLAQTPRGAVDMVHDYTALRSGLLAREVATRPRPWSVAHPEAEALVPPVPEQSLVEAIQHSAQDHANALHSRSRLSRVMHLPLRGMRWLLGQRN